MQIIQQMRKVGQKVEAKLKGSQSTKTEEQKSNDRSSEAVV